MTAGDSSSTEGLEALRTALGAQYTVERVLGQGGMGAVYLGRDVTLDRPVAIKVINPEIASNATLRERFLQEARTVARLRHPNIVSVYAAGESNGLLYFAMELVPGESLREVMVREGKISGERAEHVVREVALALDHAHSLGLVHRDVKPENILIDKESGRAMLTDFGVSRAFEVDGGLTQTGMIVGSPRYMSPEQASGDRAIDGRSDLYSLALVGYELFAGAPVIQSGTAASMLVKHLTETPPPLAEKVDGIPEHVAAAIDRGLAKDPNERWQTGREFAEALAGRALTPTGELRGAGVRARKKRGPIGIMTGVAAAMVIAAVAWWRFGGAPEGTAYLVAPFEIQSGDQSVAWLREGSVNMLTLTLGQWSDLHVVDYERTLSLLDKAELGEKTRLSLDDALKVARLADAGTVVTGQVQTINDSLIVVAKLYNVRSGKSNNQAQAQAALGTDPRPLFDKLAQQLLQIEGGGRTSTMQLAQATTSNLEAYRAYLSGVKHLNSWRLSEADSAFARAIALDSTFALAYHKRSLGLGWSEAGGPRYMPAVDQALALSGRLPPRERALVKGHYHLAHGIHAATLNDTVKVAAEYQAAIKAYSDLIAQGDSLVAEAWYGLADAYFHARTGLSDALLNEYNTRALRGFNRTLALDSTFHLAYSHLIQLYNATATGSGLVISGDTSLLLDDATARRLGSTGIAKIRSDARARGVEISRAWARADQSSIQPHLQLAQSYIAANQMDSAAGVLREAIRGTRSGAPTARIFLLALQGSVGDAGLDSTVRYVIDRFTVDSLRTVTPNARFDIGGQMLAATAQLGRTADMEKAAQLILAADSTLPGTTTPNAFIVGFYQTALRVAMGDSLTPRLKRELTQGLRDLDELPGGVGEQVRTSSVSVPYLAFLASRDTALSAIAEKWGRVKFPELDALAALSRGDTATARTLAERFTSPDSIRLARLGVGGMRSIARAEVLDAVGRTRQAAETYEAVSPDRINRMGWADPGYTVWVRSFLARARLWTQLGERERAVAAYEEFIRRWKDADGVAAKQVTQAKQELAQLKDAPRQ